MFQATRPTFKIIESYDAFFLDAYGVLVTSAGPIDHAASFLAELRHQRKPFYILTNDASRSPSLAAEHYQRNGLAIEPAQVLSAGLVLQNEIKRLKKNPFGLVLGTEASRQMARDAGAIIENHSVFTGDFQNESFSTGATNTVDTLDFIAVCDDSGFDTLPALNRVLSRLLNFADEAPEKLRHLPLFLTNPDLVYPIGKHQVGITSGGLAHLLEEALRTLLPDFQLAFRRLGKPSLELFEMATERLNLHLQSDSSHSPPLGRAPKILMIGDQLKTDILGAHHARIDSALVLTGLSQARHLQLNHGPSPNFIWNDLKLESVQPN